MATATVNGRSVDLPEDDDALLVDVLRDRLGLTGTKLVCGAGVCGACTVLIDGEAVVSCLMPAKAAAGKSILTVEGVGGPTSSRAARLHGRGCAAMRLLHAGLYRRGEGVLRRMARRPRLGLAFARGNRRRIRRPSLPLRGLRQHFSRGGRRLRRRLRSSAHPIAAGRGAREGDGRRGLYARHSPRRPARRRDPALGPSARPHRRARSLGRRTDAGRCSRRVAARRGQNRHLRRRADRGGRGGGPRDGRARARRHPRDLRAASSGGRRRAAKDASAPVVFPRGKGVKYNAGEGGNAPASWNGNVRGPVSAFSLRRKAAEKAIAAARPGATRCLSKPRFAPPRSSTIRSNRMSPWRISMAGSDRRGLDPDGLRARAGDRETLQARPGPRPGCGKPCRRRLRIEGRARHGDDSGRRAREGGGKPVRVAYSRHEELSVAGYRPGVELEMKLFPGRDGT